MTLEERHYRVAEWPVEERPREKLAARGARSLSDSELLAILLRVGSRKETVVALAQRLLAHFGGLSALSAARIPELSAISGVGMAKGAQLLAAFELGRRAAAPRDERDPVISSGQEVYDILGAKLRDARRESFWALLLNQKHRLLKTEKISEGSLTMTLVHPREAFLPAVRESAAAVIFVHNHPSGDPEPSVDDYNLTVRLIECGELLGIRVVDHIVLGDHAFVSLRDRGAFRQK
ncbi:MAG: RadC family protein [Leptospirillum sp.]|jgi:DNA repair protein RadC